MQDGKDCVGPDGDYEHLRETKNDRQEGFTLWFTGLPCSRKSTLANLLHERLRARGLKTELPDGDVVRQHLTKGLGFSTEDRDENIRRIER